MRTRIILPLFLLIFVTGCGAAAKKASVNLEPDDKEVEASSDVSSGYKNLLEKEYYEIH